MNALEETNLHTPQPSRETFQVSGIARRSPITVSVGLRTASKGSSSPIQNQTHAYGASRSARDSKSAYHHRWGPEGLKPDSELWTTQRVYRGSGSKSRSRNGWFFNQ
ncbi:hypothetical protein SFRURICE_012372 [Spodoptera frugiperda]|nr:hypothetical protein SFRURICE_012372 [Spodoptera frugiperda]